MPDLNFEVEGAEAVPFSAAPLLAFKLRLSNQPAEEVIHSVALRCQLMIEVTRRRYTDGEQERLFELFGEPERWGQTLRNMLWTHSSIVVPSFTGSARVDLPVSCTFDFNVAATKYFAGLEDGEVPLEFLFSGTVFYESDAEVDDSHAVRTKWLLAREYYKWCSTLLTVKMSGVFNCKSEDYRWLCPTASSSHSNW